MERCLEEWPYKIKGKQLENVLPFPFHFISLHFLTIPCLLPIKYMASSHIFYKITLT